VFFQA